MTPGAFAAAEASDTDDAGKSVRRTHEKSESLVRQRRIGDVAAEAAQENVILHPGHNGRAIWRFCFHAVFRDVLAPSLPL